MRSISSTRPRHLPGRRPISHDSIRLENPELIGEEINNLMRFHDFHLQGYEVTDFGETITLHLTYPYPNRAGELSDIRFSEVVLYHFTHTSGAIITDIEEWPIEEFVRTMAGQLVEWNRLYGLRGLKNPISSYSEMLQSEGYQAWEISSAIGFYGFVVSKAVSEVQTG